MRRIIQLSVACLAAGAVSACSGRDAVTETGVAPTGGVRFINAVPDTAGSGGIDFRFVDLVENNAQYNIPFRNTISTSGGVPASTQIQFKATAAGNRHFRIFLDDSLTSVAQLRLGCPTTISATDHCVGDSTMTVVDQHRYTALLWGNSRGGATPMKLTIIDETCAPTDTTQIGLRVINASTSTTIDVSQYTGRHGAGNAHVGRPRSDVDLDVHLRPDVDRHQVQRQKRRHGDELHHDRRHGAHRHCERHRGERLSRRHRLRRDARHDRRGYGDHRDHLWTIGDGHEGSTVLDSGNVVHVGSTAEPKQGHLISFEHTKQRAAGRSGGSFVLRAVVRAMTKSQLAASPPT